MTSMTRCSIAIPDIHQQILAYYKGNTLIHKCVNMEYLYLRSRTLHCPYIHTVSKATDNIAKTLFSKTLQEFENVPD